MNVYGNGRDMSGALIWINTDDLTTAELRVYLSHNIVQPLRFEQVKILIV